MINSPGKVLIFGGYNLLMNKIRTYSDSKYSYLPSISLVGAIVDSYNIGITAKIQNSSEDRIISKLYKIDETPSIKSKNLVSIAMATAIKYLKSKKLYKNPSKIEIIASKIFGTPENKTGMGSSSASISSTIKAVFKANGLDYKNYLDIIYKLSLAAYNYGKRKTVGFDFAVAVYEKNVIFSKTANIFLDLKNINKPLKLEITPTNCLDDLEVLIYDTGYSLSTDEAIKAFLEVYNKPNIKQLARKYFISEYNGVKALLNKNYKEANKITIEIREIINKIWDNMNINKDYEPDEIKEIIKDVNKLDGVVLTRLHGAGGESLLVLIKSSYKEKIINYMENNYPELKLIDANLIKTAKQFKASTLK